MKNQLSSFIYEVVKDVSKEIINDLIEIPPQKEMGDYALPCFQLAKRLHKSPAVIASEIKNALEKVYNPDIERVEAINGYLNLWIKKENYIKKVLEAVRWEDYGTSKIGAGKTICMDYSSPNIAKNFHVGHLRTTIIGNSLYKIYKKLGYDVVRINHLGDWGTQFGKLIVAYKKWSSKEKVEKDGIEELLRIYVMFHEEAKENPLLLDEARTWFLLLEQGNEEAKQIWEWFVAISMIEYERMYDLLTMEFDYYTGESFYCDLIPDMIEELKQKNLLEESQGAMVVNLENSQMPPCLIMKTDGTSIYPSRDITTILYRKKTFDFYQCIYVTGSEQKLHFAQVFEVIRRMGYDYADRLIHVPYGLVRLEGAKLSSRGGNIVYAEDIVREAIKRAQEAIDMKNPNLEDKEQVAHMVGVGAIIFHDLYHQRIKDVDFQWEQVLSFEGATGPYVQYTYARAKSILRKSGRNPKEIQLKPEYLTDTESYELVKGLANYPDILMEAANRYEPSIITRYVTQLAQAFNKFYHECNILNSEETVMEARLVLIDCVEKVIKDAMELLGIQCPEEM